MLIQFWIFIYIYIYIKERNERKLWLSSSVLNRFVSMELCTSESTKFLDRKGVVFDGTRRITTCPRGFRACVRDATRLTKRLLGQSSTEFRRCSILRFDTSSGLLDHQTDSPSGEWAKMRVSAWNNEQFWFLPYLLGLRTWFRFVSDCRNLIRLPSLGRNLCAKNYWRKSGSIVQVTFFVKYFVSNFVHPFFLNRRSYFISISSLNFSIFE